MKKNIAILRGGTSSEKVISLQSAQVVFQHIDSEKYNKYIVHIENKNWIVIQDTETYPIDKNDFSFIKNNQKISFHGVFMAIHGTPGEDGVLQGYFDLLNIPYNCCSSIAAGITFNKGICNMLLKQHQITSARAIMIHNKNPYDFNSIEQKIGLPCIVKPNRGGSSFGISKVTKADQWEKALKIAFKHDDQVVVEAFIEGTELSCGIIEKNGELIAFPITEISTENDFFNYEAKYHGKALEITPARINNAHKDKIQSISKKIYNILGLKGIVRMDFILKEEEPYLIEVNTVPGLSEESIIPKQAKCYGMSLQELFHNSLETMFQNND